MVEGKVTEVKAVQPLNAPPPILSSLPISITPSGITMDVRFLQNRNVPPSIIVNLGGRVIDVMAVPKNANAPNFSRFCGKVTDASEVHP